MSVARIGTVLQPVVKAGITKGRQYLDYAFAVATGTAIGIGNNPEVRQAFEYYKGKTRYTSWQDRYIRRRFKGDVYVDETRPTQHEALRSDEPFYGNYRSRGGRQFSGRRSYRKQRRGNRGRRRCYCKRHFHSTMGYR